MIDEQTLALFTRYKETGDLTIRNQIAEKYLYIAEVLAKKFVGRGVEYDDLHQVAALALVRGIDRFDPTLGMQFSTFITPTITGEIKNYFRDKSRMVKLPRKLSEISTQVRKFSADYQSEHGVKPSIAVIAKSLGLSEEHVVKALEVGGTVSLDGMTGGTDGEENPSLYGVLASGEEAFDAFETRESLLAAMKDFSDTEKQLIAYRYLQELSQSETAMRLGVSQMFVSRTERKLLSKLKERLQDSV